MENLDLNAMGVVEMEAREESLINGGFGPGNYYPELHANSMDEASTIAGVIVGFVVGIFV